MQTGALEVVCFSSLLFWLLKNYIRKSLGWCSETFCATGEKLQGEEINSIVLFVNISISFHFSAWKAEEEVHALQLPAQVFQL